MTDINFDHEMHDEDAVALVELLFFAYRDFVADPDHVLDGLGFGRAHHRVLHFVGRDPGMTVARLLDILQITKQSLARVLKELIDKRFVFQNEGEQDRRQRLLHLTPSGEALRQKLMAPQIARFKRAAQEIKMEKKSDLRALLFHLINPENQVAAQIWLKGLNPNG
jgi:DNA-binding MarR family transcriptional regulator